MKIRIRYHCVYHVFLGDPKETVWYSLRFNVKGEAMVYERRRIKGCFLENLELDEFPFDTQVRT